jgi:hypothetical protein
MNETHPSNLDSYTALSSKDKKLLQLNKKKEADFNRILDANEDFLRQSSQSWIMKMHQLAPPSNTTTNTDRDNPCCDFITVGEYVEVEEDTSPNMNRPFGMGYVTNLKAYGEGQLVADVKYTPAFDNARIHRNIPIDHLTIVNVEQHLRNPRGAREQQQSGREEDECSVITSDKSMMEVLLDLLHANQRRKPGWHRKDLKLNEVLEEKERPHMNQLEKAQLLAEVELLKQHCIMKGGYRHSTKNRENEFSKRVNKYDPETITYLIEHAWGLKGGRSYLRKLKARVLQQSLERGVDKNTAQVMLFEHGGTIDHSEGTVIDSITLCEKHFTPEYLYSIDKWKQMVSSGIDIISNQLLV